MKNIRTVGDLYDLIKTCDALQKAVADAELAHEQCSYDPHNYYQSAIEEAQSELDALRDSEVTIFCRRIGGVV